MVIIFQEKHRSYAIIIVDYVLIWRHLFWLVWRLQFEPKARGVLRNPKQKSPNDYVAYFTREAPPKRALLSTCNDEFPRCCEENPSTYLIEHLNV